MSIYFLNVHKRITMYTGRIVKLRNNSTKNKNVRQNIIFYNILYKMFILNT
jgi:hypothetical protein